MGMRIDHIGYAVKNIDKAKKSMEALGYTFEPTIEDNDRNIFIAFGELDGYRVELVAPMGEEGTPVDMYLSKIGPTPYHICYRSSDIEADIAELQKNRFKVSIPLAPAIAFGNKRVVFMYSLSVGLIEIVED
jgi:methylmalonyl-CoA/ethylmalonyl-CoA epimerase